MPASGALTTIVLDAATGAVVKTFTEVGGSDQVWFNRGNGRYYTASRNWTKTGVVGGPTAPVLGVIDAKTLTFIQNVPTDTNAHSVAVDPVTHRVYVANGTSGNVTVVQDDDRVTTGPDAEGAAGSADRMAS